MAEILCVPSKKKGPKTKDNLSLHTQSYYHLATWNALVVPAGTPEEVSQKLTAAMQAVFAQGKLQEFATKQGFEVYPLYGKEMTTFMADEDARYGKLIAKIKG